MGGELCGEEAESTHTRDGVLCLDASCARTVGAARVCDGATATDAEATLAIASSTGLIVSHDSPILGSRDADHPCVTSIIARYTTAIKSD